MRLAAKFLSLLVFAFLLLLFVDGYLTLRRELELMDRDMERDAAQLSAGLAPLVVAAWEEGGEARVLKLIERANDPARVVRVRWVWLDVAAEHPQSPLVARKELASLVANRTQSLKHETAEGLVRLCTYTRVQIAATRPAALELAEPVTHARDMFRWFAWRTLILTAVTLLLGLLLAALLGRELIGVPLRQLHAKTRRIGSGDLSGPLNMQRRDEFGELAGALDSMCDQLATAQQRVDEETAARISALEQLRHADRLRTVGRLASGIAHELGTPLNVVSGRATMIASGQLAEQETHHSAEIIKSESERMTTIIRQLLDFARRSTPQRATLDVGKVVVETLDVLTPLAEKRGVTLGSITPDRPCLCNADAGQMRQVLTNLLMNAAQSMPDGGQIEVEVARRRAEPPAGEEAVAGDFVTIAVRDRGAGIPADSLSQVFEPFYTTKDVGEGTGLGLAIAYGIVQEHGGWIDVTSEVGEGSCFTIYLPIEEAT